jgi:hypothetical protein
MRSAPIAAPVFKLCRRTITWEMNFLPADLPLLQRDDAVVSHNLNTGGSSRHAFLSTSARQPRAAREGCLAKGRLNVSGGTGEGVAYNRVRL